MIFDFGSPKDEKKEPKKPRKPKSKRKPAMDISSGEEAATRSGGSRQPKKKREPITVKLEGPSPEPVFKVDTSGLPLVKSLSELPEDHPYMAIGEDAAQPCKFALPSVAKDSKPARKTGSGAGAERKYKAEADATPMNTREQPVPEPRVLVELRKLLNAVPRMKLPARPTATWKPSDGIRALRQGIGMDVLPFIKANFKQELARAAGRFVHRNGRTYNFPACANKESCWGMNGSVKMAKTGKPFKHILTAFIPQDDYETFIATGETPATKYPCVDCWCRDIIKFVSAFRRAQVTTTTEGKQAETFVLGENDLLQPFRFTDECAGGFHREFMMYNIEGKWEGIIGPIVAVTSELCFGSIDEYGRPYIDQSASFWKPDDSGDFDLGERVRDFSTGVGH